MVISDVTDGVLVELVVVATCGVIVELVNLLSVSVKSTGSSLSWEATKI